MVKPEPVKPPDKASSMQGKGAGQPKETTGEAAATTTQSYASATAAANNNRDKVVGVLRIVLKETKAGASYQLKPKEKADLVFMSDIPRTHGVGMDQADFRTILVHLTCLAGPWRIAHSIEVRDGLITLLMRRFQRLTNVRVVGVGGKTNEMEVVEMLKYFGTFEETFEVRVSRYYERRREQAHYRGEDA